VHKSGKLVFIDNGKGIRNLAIFFGFMHHIFNKILSVFNKPKKVVGKFFEWFDPFQLNSFDSK